MQLQSKFTTKGRHFTAWEHIVKLEVIAITDTEKDGITVRWLITSDKGKATEIQLSMRDIQRLLTDLKEAKHTVQIAELKLNEWTCPIQTRTNATNETLN